MINVDDYGRLSDNGIIVILVVFIIILIIGLNEEDEK